MTISPVMVSDDAKLAPDAVSKVRNAAVMVSNMALNNITISHLWLNLR